MGRSSVTIASPRVAQLGEGPLWHPEAQALFWFDILGKSLMRLQDESETAWSFDEHVSAAGWVDAQTLLVASETGLFRFDTSSGVSEAVLPLEADNPMTRSNDGRADPQGGFWIGTMGKSAEPHAGAIYRYYNGDLRPLFERITISNAICFAPEGDRAFFTDTPTRQIMSVTLDGEGWPAGDPEVFVDLRSEGLNPDGAVVDADGTLWNAQWGAGRVAAYDRNGAFLGAVPIEATQTTCPCFGGSDLGHLFVTSAAHGAPKDDLHAGKLFSIDMDCRGQAEHKVIL